MSQLDVSDAYVQSVKDKIFEYLLANGEVFRNGYISFISQHDLAIAIGTPSSLVNRALSEMPSVTRLTNGCYYLDGALKFKPEALA